MPHARLRLDLILCRGPVPRYARRCDSTPRCEPDSSRSDSVITTRVDSLRIIVVINNRDLLLWLRSRIARSPSDCYAVPGIGPKANWQEVEEPS